MQLHLPKELIRLIISFLRLNDLIICRLICKLFMQVIDNHFVKLRICITPEISKKDKQNRFRLDKALEVCEEAGPKTREKITFVSLYTHSDDFDSEKKLISMLPNIQFLEIYLYSIFSARKKPNDFLIDNFVRNLPNSITRLELNDVRLESLDSLPISLSYLSISSGSFRYENLIRLSSLRKLCISGFEQPEILQHIPTSVHSLLIWFQHQITSLNGLQNLKKLKTLDLTALSITDEEFRYIPTSLKKLTIQELKLTTRACFSMIPPTLTFLEINGPNHSVDEASQFLPVSLKKLILANCEVTLSKFNFPPSLSFLGFNGIFSSGEITFKRFPKYLNKFYSSHFIFDIDLLITLPETVASVSLIYRDNSVFERLPQVLKMFKEENRYIIVTLKYYNEKWIETELKSWD